MKNYRYVIFKRENSKKKIPDQISLCNILFYLTEVDLPKDIYAFRAVKKTY